MKSTGARNSDDAPWPRHGSSVRPLLILLLSACGMYFVDQLKSGMSDFFSNMRRQYS